MTGQTPAPQRNMVRDDDRSGLDALDLDVDRHLPVSEQVHGALRAAIIDVRLRPGERISENSICRRFSVSRTPVRAAIQRLVEEGLVEVSPQRGSFVTPMDLNHLRDCHFVRRTLELALLQVTVPRWTPAMGAALRAIVGDQARVVAKADRDGFFEEDERFHRTLAGFSGRAGVWPAIKAASMPLSRFHRYWGSLPRLSDVLDEHLAVIDALERGDGAAARTALETHLNMVFVIFERMSDAEKRKLPFDTGGAGRSPGKDTA